MANLLVVIAFIFIIAYTIFLKRKKQRWNPVVAIVVGIVLTLLIHGGVLAIVGPAFIVFGIYELFVQKKKEK